MGFFIIGAIIFIVGAIYSEADKRMVLKKRQESPKLYFGTSCMPAMIMGVGFSFIISFLFLNFCVYGESHATKVMQSMNERERFIEKRINSDEFTSCKCVLNEVAEYNQDVIKYKTLKDNIFTQVAYSNKYNELDLIRYNVKKAEKHKQHSNNLIVKLKNEESISYSYS